MRDDATRVFITGGTGYIGRRLIPVLRRQGCMVTALVRAGSEGKLPPGCQVVVGNPLDRTSFEGAIEPYSTFVQLVGVPHPSPAKAQQFYDIDLASARASIDAAAARQVDHFVYVSVAQPAPVMRDYIAARAEAEAALRESGLAATVLRPWYVLGPGHRWPYALLPLFALLKRLPRTRETARRLGFVTLARMLAALVNAVEDPPESGVRIVTAEEIAKGR